MSFKNPDRLKKKKNIKKGPPKPKNAPLKGAKVNKDKKPNQ